MKRIFCFLIILSLFFLFGCQNKPVSYYDKPVYFYYPYSDIDLYSTDNAVAYEIREGAEILSDNELIQTYLDGPKRNELYSPFPTGGSVVDSIVTGNRIRVILSSHFDRLLGVQLTMATSCLALTLLDTKNISIVEIHILADDGAISRSFFLTRDNIMLDDSYRALPVE